MNALAKRMEVATELATRAGELALRMRPPPGSPVATLKGAQDWLTEADRAVEEFLSTHLAEAFPEDGFQGEEAGRTRGGALRWVVDPIDGTANYARGAQRWCMSLGLVDDRTPLLGVIVAPALGERFVASQGQGAFLNNAPIRAADTTDLRRATIECGWSPRRPNASYYAVIAEVMDAGSMMRAGGSGALGLADVAAGRLDAYVELHINLWDVAAGLAILAETGASISPFMAQDGPDSGAQIIAAAPGIAGDLTARVGPLLDECNKG